MNSCGHKVEGVTPKQIKPGTRTRREKKNAKQTNREESRLTNAKQTEGDGREGSPQRTSSPGRDSEDKNQDAKDKTKSQITKGQTTYNTHIAGKISSLAGHGRKAAISAAQGNPDREARRRTMTRTRDAPRSE